MKEWYPCVNFERCGNKIPFSDRDEEFYISQGWTNPDGSVKKPKRCRACRDERKRNNGDEKYQQKYN